MHIKWIGCAAGVYSNVLQARKKQRLLLIADKNVTVGVTRLAIAESLNCVIVTDN